MSREFISVDSESFATMQKIDIAARTWARWRLGQCDVPDGLNEEEKALLRAVGTPEEEMGTPEEEMGTPEEAKPDIAEELLIAALTNVREGHDTTAERDEALAAIREVLRRRAR